MDMQLMINKTSLAALCLGLALAGCASSVELSNDALMQRSRMTQQQAESQLAAFARATPTHGGLCLLGAHVVLTRLDPAAPVSVVGSSIRFTGRYAELAGADVAGNVAAGTGQVAVNYTAVTAASSVDAGRLTEIRVLQTNPNTEALCRFKPGYIVALKTGAGLPDQAQISFNAGSQAELDSLLATLSFLSPHAKLVSGLGM